MESSLMQMSGRIYNAMMKFAGGTKSYPQLAKMFFSHGKIYTTNSFVMCRWTPSIEYEILDTATGKKIEQFYFTPRMNKIAAGTTIFIDSTSIDIDCNSGMLQNENLSKMIGDEYKHPIDSVLGVNPNYLAAIATLGKAVKADKCGSNGTIDIDWMQKVLHAHIDAGCNGCFDIIVMPCVDRNKAKKEK